MKDEIKDFYTLDDYFDLLDRLEATDMDPDTVRDEVTLKGLHKLVIRRERERGMR